MSDECIQSAPGSQDEPRSRFARIIEATTDVVAIADAGGRLSYLNAAGRQLLSLPIEGDISEKSLRDLHPAWACEILNEEALPSAGKDGSWSGETALLSSSGKEIPALQVVLAHTGADGRLEFISTISRDISDRKQKELEQIEWANRYNAAIRASGQVVFDWDTTSGEVTYCGETERLLGLPTSEMRGGIEQLRRMVHTEDLPGFDEQFEGAKANRDPFEHTFRVTRPNGSEAVLHAHGCFFLDRNGHIGRMVGFLADITVEQTAEKNIQRAYEQLEQRVKERTGALARANEELKNSAMRQAAVARLGQRALAGQPLKDLMLDAAKTVRDMLPADCTSVLRYDEDAGIFRSLAETGWSNRNDGTVVSGGNASQSGYTVQIGEPIVSPDFSKETRFQPSPSVRNAGLMSGLTVCIKAGERPLGVLGGFLRERREFSRDDVSFVQSIANVISAAIDRNQAEENIRRAQADAETANRAKSEFLSRMSHELRTPLNAILGFTQLLEMEEHSEKQGESIAHISRAGRNLLELINEVLDIARLDSGRIQFNVETVDVAELLRDVVAATSTLTSRRKLTVRIADCVGEEPFVSSDRERLKQVLLNLMSNAVKYNQDGGSITLAVARTSPAAWRVSVTDTGQGIPQDKLARLFVPFERLGTREGGTEGGTGLGLALCQRLVTGLGGRIGVASTVGLGSTFWVEIPASEIAPAKPAPVTPSIVAASIVAPPAAPEPPARTTRKVLYIEDDVANFYLLERFLKSRKDVELVSALQGSIGIDLARAHKPDLILLDLNLPDMNGEQILRALRSDVTTADSTVVAVTGEIFGEREQALKELGIAGTLVKPYKLSEITSLLDRTFAAA